MVFADKIQQTIREDEYDSLSGRFMRKVKPWDIFHIASTPGTSVGATATLTSGTTSANVNVIITGFGISASTACNVWVTAGSSTLLPIRLSAAGQTSVISTHDSPLFRVPESTTISIVADVAGTYSAWLCGYREPIISKREV